MTNKISKLQIIRHITQIIFLIFIPDLFTLIFSQIKQIYLMISSGNFSTTYGFKQLLTAIIIIPLTILLGRFFCGWLCTFGAVNDFIYIVSRRLFKIKFKISEQIDSKLKYLKYIILVFIALFIWTGTSNSFDSYSPWTAFAYLDNPNEAILKYTGGFTFLVLIAIGAIFIERFFCRYLCPLGAVYSIVSKIRIFKISKPREKCGNCRLCTNNCSMGIKLYEVDKVSSGECINCLKCIDTCPRKNTQATIFNEKVNPLLPSAVAIAAFTGLNSLGSTIMKNNTEGSVQNSSTISVNNNKPQQNEYKDGTYTGSAYGKNSDIKVSVTVKSGKISNIEILSSNESKGKQVFDVVPKAIIDNQSTKVDAVSGATLTSKAVMEAVNNALNEAKVGNISTDINNSEQSEYKDGTYTGVGHGKNPDLKVSVTVKEGKIGNIEILSSKETKGKEAFNVVTKEIIATQSTKVDAVSGATLSSKGVMEAVNNALNESKK